MAVASSFYAAIAHSVPNVDTSSPRFREQVAPLNAPAAGMSPDVRDAARDASTTSFHLAMLVAATLLFAGAAVNGIGIRNPSPSGRHLGPGAEQPPGESGSPTGPVASSAEAFSAQEASGVHTGPARDTS